MGFMATASGSYAPFTFGTKLAQVGIKGLQQTQQIQYSIFIGISISFAHEFSDCRSQSDL